MRIKALLRKRSRASCQAGHGLVHLLYRYIPIMSQSLENLMGKIPSVSSQMTGLFISVVKIIMVLIPMPRVTVSLLLN